MRDIAIRFVGAVEQGDGSYLQCSGRRSWYNAIGELHREDGPASIINNNVAWYLNGKIYTIDEWLNKVVLTDEDKMLLRLQYE